VSGPSSNILAVKHLSVAFGGEPVLRDVSFSLPAGASLAIIGPNGAGKTVLFRALIGAVRSTGSIHWSPDARLGFVPQKLDLGRDVPVSAGDLLAARASLVRKTRAGVIGVLPRVGLDAAILRSPISALSGGQFQRLLVAFALIGDPTVLLLDEPTASVDTPGETRLNELWTTLREESGITILLISHELSVVRASATHVLCLGGQHHFFGGPAMLTPPFLSDLYGEPVVLHDHAH
jgi:zinc transport system ATP-binding protein